MPSLCEDKIEKLRNLRRGHFSPATSARKRALYRAEDRRRQALRLWDYARASRQARRTVPDLPERFHEQAQKWQRETSSMSSPLQRMLHPSYQAVMGMAAEGAEARREIIRLMLHDIKHQHRDWLVALGFLTQENPIQPRDAGRTDRIVKAWLKWAEERGIDVQ